MRNLVFLLLIGLVVYTIVDVTRSEREERFGIPKAIWIILMVLFPLIGSVAWLALSRSVRNKSQGPTRNGGRRSTKPPVQLGPDDDPEFLWRLERDLKRDTTDPGDDSTPQDPATPPGTTP